MPEQSNVILSRICYLHIYVIANYHQKRNIVAATIITIPIKAYPCFSCFSSPFHLSAAAVNSRPIASKASISHNHRIRTYKRYAAIGNITVFKPIQDNCLPNTADMPMPAPMTIQLSSSTKTTHLCSSKSNAVHIPTTIRNIKGNASCRIGSNVCGNSKDLPKIECQSLLIHFPISLPSAIMKMC